MKWKVIHDMDNDDGTPTCYVSVLGEYYWFVTKFYDGWHIEYQKTNRENELETVFNSKTEHAGKRWVEKHHIEIEEAYN